MPTTDPLLEGISEPADNADALADHERTMLLVGEARDMLAQVNEVLARLDAGTYGICAECGKEIDARRLEALPYATLCIDDQAAAEAAGS